MKNTLIAIVVLVLLGAGVYFITKKTPSDKNVTDNSDVTLNADGTSKTPVNPNPAEVTPQMSEQTSIGKSVDGNDIIAYNYGTGSTKLLFIGGIHGGYSWNTSLVAFNMIDYLKANPQIIPANVEVTVIPVMNPDGLKKVTGSVDRFLASDVNASQAVQVSGRFNANNVDLSRNFDCDWQTKGVWQSKTVSGGTAVFSEPESMAIKNYVEANNPSAVVVWYAAAGGVFASNCHGGVLPETTALTNLYAKASLYPASDSYDFYKVTGDMVNWLAKEKIPAISVLLTNHTDVEWDKNKAGIDAVLAHYAKSE